ncbi:alpha-protein kinase vwkA-like [Daphnia carinata]|uniref:alpha-protein kinase vwkA-like n=1 Tax=Daphnia carinata TaxID=120202 RepID=UPI002868F5B7|nr:alpha-protein kinase vwkA-like [Daphnia carinata]
MYSYINEVKEQIVEIVARLEASGCGIEGLAFVGYKDWCDGINHFEILPFTKSVSEFKSFVATICAKGGGDFPEDVLGGLSRAISLNWPQNSGTRIIFHLGDAPAHGKTIFHDGRRRDDYENGHPNDPPLQELFREMRRKKLMYYFGRINGECDRMIATFERYLGEKIETVDSAEVGNVLRSVMESVMRSVSVTHRTDFPSMVDKKLLPFNMDKKEPNWDQLPRLDGTILTFELPTSVEEITSFAKLQDKIKKCRLQIAPNPFAKGSVRLAYFGKIFYSSSKDANSSASESVDGVVFKEIISPPKVADLDCWRYRSDLEVQTVAAKLAKEFNFRLFKTHHNPNITMKFLKTKVARVFKDVAPRYLAYEQRFRGVSPNMVKYTNNVDFVHDA